EGEHARDPDEEEEGPWHAPEARAESGLGDRDPTGLAHEADADEGDRCGEGGDQDDEAVRGDLRPHRDKDREQDEGHDRADDRPRRVHAAVEAERLPPRVRRRGLREERVPRRIPYSLPEPFDDPKSEELRPRL